MNEEENKEKSEAEKLITKWAPVLETGKKIEDELFKGFVAQCLENVRNHYIDKGVLNETSDVGTDKSKLVNITIPAIRRLLPELPILNMVGCIAVDKPESYVMSLGVANNYDSSSSFQKIDWSETYPAPCIAFTKREVKAEYHKYGVLLNSIYSVLGEFIAFDAIKVLMEAGITSSIYDKMKKAIAPNAETIELSSNGNWDEDLKNNFLKTTNEIAIKTRRGMANVVLASPWMVNTLMRVFGKDASEFKENPAHPIQVVGTINEDRQLLLCDNTCDMTERWYIAGYRGHIGNDAGIIYTPYLPMVIDKTLENKDIECGGVDDVVVLPSCEDFYTMVKVK